MTSPAFSFKWIGQGETLRLQLCWENPPGTLDLSWKEVGLIGAAMNAHSVLRNEWAQDATSTSPDPSPCTPVPPRTPNAPQRPPTASTVHRAAILQGFRHALSIVARRRAMECHPWGLAVLTDAEVMLMTELKVLENPLGPPAIGDLK